MLKATLPALCVLLFSTAYAQQADTVMQQPNTDYIELFKTYFIDSKAWGGLLFSGFGILLLIGSIKDWNWIFGDVSPVTYDLGKIDGWINIFGRKTARVLAGIGGVVLFFIGIGWTVICIYRTSL